jgi:N-formylmaleamate deformylase
MAEILRIGRHFIANGIRLHYVRFGTGKAPIVLLPGITSPAATWEFVAQAMAEYNDVYVLDIRGRGLSQGGPDLPYGLDDYVADAAAFINNLNLGSPPAVVGHSMGARIAARLAARHPALVGKLVLVDPPVSGPGRRPYPIPLDYYLQSMAAVANGQGYEAMKQSLPWSDEQLQVRMEWLPTCEPEAIVQSHRSFHEDDMHADLPAILAPTLLLYAENGGTVTDSDALEILKSIKDCQHQKVAGAGHMIPWDQLDVFVSAVKSFLHA